MSFDHPWLAGLAALPLLWMLLSWRRSERRAGLALKALALAAIVLALSQPRLSISENKMAVAVLVDTSASVSPEDLKRASSLAAAIENARGRNIVRVIPFARQTRPLGPLEPAALTHTSGEAGRGTNLESAVREAVASLPAGLVHRVALISDGRENTGSMARGAWQAAQIGVPIDTYALAGRPRPTLRLESVTLPPNAFTGERFPIDIDVVAPRAVEATLEIAAEGKTIGKNSVALEAGSNRVRAHAAINEPGAINLSLKLRAPDSEIGFEQAITLRRPRVLYVSEDPAGTEIHFLKTLEASRFETVRSADLSASALAGVQLAILNNQDLEAIPAGRKADIEAYVKQGGGLLVIGGERNVYVENKTVEDALDRVLPAKLAPPRSPEGTCVVLIIDKSSSMEGRKMELARLAAIGAIDNIRPIDLVGVLIFDNSFQWAVPIRRAEDRTLIKRLVAGITPDGGTQIAPALAEGYRKIVPAKATYKHIVLLTDGISEEGDSMTLAREAAQQRVTISTVGLGQDVNRAFLEKVASFSKGKSYFLVDPSGLEQILIRDIMEHTGTTAVEKQLRPAVVKQAEILEGVEIETAPPLRGYVKFIAKPSAETILTMDEKDPLLTRWQFGLGRAAVFTSDAKSRWAEGWVTWKGFDRFWANLLRDLLPRAPAGEANVQFDPAGQELIVDYRLAPHVEAPARIQPIFIFGPDGFRQPIEVKKTAEGGYRGRLRIGDRQGLFRIRPLVESRVFPETGFYRQEAELAGYGSDEAALKRVAEYTGGLFQPNPASVFNPGDRSVASVMELWPGLLALAIALNLAELILRKWRSIRDTFRPTPN